MNLQGRKVLVNKSVEELRQMLDNPEDYKDLMPENLKTFEVHDQGFTFELKGMPKIGLKINSVTDEEVLLTSANPSLDFTLKGTMDAIAADKTEVQLLFEGKFNTFIKMMVEKPLQNFINALTDKIETL